MSRHDQIQAALQRDADQMQDIYEEVASGKEPDAAAAEVIGGEFQLSEPVQDALKGNS